MKFPEAQLEQAFIGLLENEGYTHFVGSIIVVYSSETDQPVPVFSWSRALRKRYESPNNLRKSRMGILSNTGK